MASLTAHRWLRKLLGQGLAWPGLLLALLWPAAAPAQEIHYLNKTSFGIPFIINPNQQTQIEQVVLWVSENGRDYQKAAQSVPSATSFQYKAPREGRFDFVVQAEYKTGQRVPSDPRTVNPGLRVHVDTTAPVIAAFRQIQPRDGTLGVEWDIREDNPNFQSLRIDYRAAGTETWTPLNIGSQLNYGQFSWTPPVSAAQFEVRLSVSDRAANATERYLRVYPGGVQQSAASPPSPTPQPQNRLMMINTKTLRLNYDLFDKGKSDVKSIEVWATQDAQVWKKVMDQPPAVSTAPASILVTVTAEGRWGFKLIAKSGVGRGEPDPTRGTQPDNWVEVDITPPEVKMLGASVSGVQDNGQVEIRWTAQDRHLAERPISLYYSTDEKPDKQWNPIASGLANDGKYIWPIPPDLPHHLAYIKVEAVDLAGNVGVDKPEKPVITDLAVPKVRIKTLEGAPQAPGIPGMSGASGISSGTGIVHATGIEAVPPRPQDPPPGSLPGSAPGTFASPSPMSPSAAPPGLIPP